MKMIKELTDKNGISGFEDEVRNYLLNYVKNYVSSIEVDNMGNLIAHKNIDIKKKTIALCAHMDEVGFIVKEITESGLLKFDIVGGIDSDTLSGKTVLIGDNKVKGVISIIPDKLKSAPRDEIIKNIFIDIGAINKREAKNVVSIGDFVVFENKFSNLGGNIISAKALDDRVGCALICNLLRNNYDYNIIACFTTQEEIGLRGARILFNSYMPHYAIILDCTPSFDLPGINNIKDNIKGGKGPVLYIRDSIAFYDEDIVKKFCEISKEYKIPIQIKCENLGATDAAAIQGVKGGVKCAAVSVPCKFMHSSNTLIDMNDFKNVYSLIDAFLKSSNI